MIKNVFRKGLVIGIIVLFVGASVIPSMGVTIVEKQVLLDNKTSFTGFNPCGNIWHVDDDNCPGPGDGTEENPFCKIQDAINNASSGDTIYVFNGTYNENVRIEEKSLTLEGENKESTIIDGGGRNTNIIFIRGLDCTDSIITDFTIQNTNISGIYTKYPNNIIIKNNIITNCYNGIELTCGYDHSIEDNIISYNKNGLYAYYITDSLITLNHFENNENIGLWLETRDTTSNRIELNEFKNNGIGVFIYDGQGNYIENNNFIDNGKHATFYNGRNIWYKNYWDNTYLSFYLIWGVWRLYILPWIQIPFPQIDRKPKSSPYDIP